MSAPAEEPRPVAPLLLAGAVRGAPAGLAAALPLALFADFLDRRLWANRGAPPPSDLAAILIVAIVAGVTLGATLSAADAASRRSPWPRSARLTGAVLAPLLAGFTGFCTAMTVQGYLTFRVPLLLGDLLLVAVFGLGPPALAFLLGGALAGRALPGLSLGARLARTGRFTIGPLGLPLFLLAAAPGGDKESVWVWLFVAAIATSAFAYSLVHTFARPLYLWVRAKLEPES